MINDFSKSIKASLYERATSPLFGTFLISWSLWNYKLLFVLGSSLDVHEKFEYIELFIYTSLEDCILFGGIYPLITTAAFIFLYPYPAKYVYKYWQNRQKELKEIKQTIEDETPLTIDESREIRRELLKVEGEYDSELSRKDSEIDRLKEIIKHLEQEVSSLSTPAKRTLVPKKVTPKKVVTEKPSNSEELKLDAANEQLEILQFITNNGGLVRDQEIFNHFKYDKVKIEYYLEDLEGRSLVSRGYKGPSNTTGTELTTKGKKLMVEKGIAK